VKRLVLLLVLTVFVLALTLQCSVDLPEVPSIDVQKALNWKNNDYLLIFIDVRTKPEFEGELGRISNSILIPLQELESSYHKLDSLKIRDIIVYCRSGNRSVPATRFLIEKGFKARNMLWGIKAWNKLK